MTFQPHQGGVVMSSQIMYAQLFSTQTLAHLQSTCHLHLDIRSCDLYKATATCTLI